MQKNKTFWGIIAFIIVAVIGIAFMFVGEADVSPKKGPDQLVTFDGAELNEEENGKLVWRLTAEKILYNPTTKDIFLTNATGEFYKGDEKMIVKANEGTVTNKQEKIVLKGAVHATSTDGMEMKGEDLMYLPKKGTFQSDRPFWYKKDTTVITGDRIKGDSILQKIQAEGHVKLIKEQ